MKYLTSIFFVIILSSCCGTKRVVENVPKNDSKAIAKVEAHKKAKKPKQVNKVPEIVKEEEPVIEHDITFETFSHLPWNSLLKKHVSNSGNVNYTAFKNNRKALLNYIDSLGKSMPAETWPKEEKLAFWINAYNAMTIDLILRHYPLKSIKDIKKPWEQHLWTSVGIPYNLNDIEHKILRKMNEPRIHFAIVCASVSCPKLLNEAYKASKLEVQLTNAATGFLNDSTKNEISENNLKLSKIFQWFAKDFKQDGRLIDFLNRYTAVQISAKAKTSFKKFNWALNE